MSIKVKNDPLRRYVAVQEGDLLCNRLQLRDKLLFETHNTWGALLKTQTYRRKLQTIDKITDWMNWYIPKKLNCETWYCNKKEKNRVLNKYNEWKYTILYVVNSEKGEGDEG